MPLLGAGRTAYAPPPVGAALARQHRLPFGWCGHPCGTRTYPLQDFHRRAVETMRALAARCYAADEVIQDLLEEMCRYARVLPLPGLARVRRVYRYLYRLIEIQSATPIGEWLAWPAWFDEGEHA